MSLMGPALSNLLSQSGSLLWLGFRLNVAPKESRVRLDPPGAGKCLSHWGHHLQKRLTVIPWSKPILAKVSPRIPLASCPSTWLSSMYVLVSVTLSAMRPSQKPERFWLPGLGLPGSKTVSQINAFFLKEPSLRQALIASKTTTTTTKPMD